MTTLVNDNDLRSDADLVGIGTGKTNTEKGGLTNVGNGNDDDDN